MRTVNFGGNVELNPGTAYVPETEQEVLGILDSHRGQRIRCVGRLHSWSRAIEVNEVLLDLRKLNHVITSEAALKLGWIGLADILVFFGVLLVGFAYVWKRGDLDWIRALTKKSQQAKDQTAGVA